VRRNAAAADDASFRPGDEEHAQAGAERLGPLEHGQIDGIENGLHGP